MSASSDGSFASRFTDEILDNIFLQLAAKQILHCECVCTRFRSWSKGSIFWDCATRTLLGPAAYLLRKRTATTAHDAELSPELEKLFYCCTDLEIRWLEKLSEEIRGAFAGRKFALSAVLQQTSTIRDIAISPVVEIIDITVHNATGLTSVLIVGSLADVYEAHVAMICHDYQNATNAFEDSTQVAAAASLLGWIPNHPISVKAAWDQQQLRCMRDAAMQNLTRLNSEKNWSLHLPHRFHQMMLSVPCCVQLELFETHCDQAGLLEIERLTCTNIVSQYSSSTCAITILGGLARVYIAHLMLMRDVQIYIDVQNWEGQDRFSVYDSRDELPIPIQ